MDPWASTFRIQVLLESGCINRGLGTSEFFEFMFSGCRGAQRGYEPFHSRFEGRSSMLR